MAPRIGPAAALAAALALGALACGPAPAPEPARGRVLLVGIDGAEPRVTFPWIDAGDLPVLAGLARAGASGPIRSHHPLLSPRIWTSIATGKGPAGHRIFSWVTPDADGRLRLMRSSDRSGWALWNIASESHLRVGVVNWLNTHPAEIVDGVVISDLAIPGQREEREDLGRVFVRHVSQGAQTRLPPEPIAAGTTHPASWEARVPALVSDASLLPDGDDPFAALASMLDAERIARLRAILRMDLAAARIALAVERELEPDLLMVYLPGIDRTSHLLWGALEPEFPFPRPLRFEGAARAAAAEAVRDYYRLTDAIIGRLLEGFGADDLVIVVSDHGFEAHAMLEHHITGGHDSPASENGVVFARGPGVRAGSAAGDVSVNDVTPTILAWLGLPVGADMDGRPAGFLAGDPPAVVASWDRGPIERVVAPAASEIEEEVIDQLRSFGYVEE